MIHPLLCLLFLCFLLLLVKLLLSLELLPQLMQLLLYFFYSLLIPLPSHDALVTLFPLWLNSHSYLFCKWICSKLAAFLLLHVVDNLPLPFVAHMYAFLYCICCCCY